MKIKITKGFIFITFGISGCAHINFNSDNGLTYYEPKPYLFVTTSSDCLSNASILVVPSEKKHIKFKTGYGSAKLSATLSNGMVTTVGQETDTKIPETITSIAGLSTAAAGAVPQEAGGNKCFPTANLYPLDNGKPDTSNPITFPVKLNTGNSSGATE